VTGITFARDADQYVFTDLAKTVWALFFAATHDVDCINQRCALQLADTTVFKSLVPQEYGGIVSFLVVTCNAIQWRVLAQVAARRGTGPRYLIHKSRDACKQRPIS
jgi:hypothetical protein